MLQYIVIGEELWQKGHPRYPFFLERGIWRETQDGLTGEQMMICVATRRG